MGYTYNALTQDELKKRERDDIIMQKSSLARTLAMLFDKLKESSACHLLVNDSLDVSFLLPEGSCPTLLDIQNSTTNKKLYSDLRPFQTLILLLDPEELLKILPDDCSPLLIRLIQTITPTQK